jgi:hypothetical protein
MVLTAIKGLFRTKVDSLDEFMKLLEKNNCTKVEAQAKIMPGIDWRAFGILGGTNYSPPMIIGANTSYVYSAKFISRAEDGKRIMLAEDYTPLCIHASKDLREDDILSRRTLVTVITNVAMMKGRLPDIQTRISKNGRELSEEDIKEIRKDIQSGYKPF